MKKLGYTIRSFLFVVSGGVVACGGKLDESVGQPVEVDTLDVGPLVLPVEQRDDAEPAKLWTDDDVYVPEHLWEIHPNVRRAMGPLPPLQPPPTK